MTKKGRTYRIRREKQRKVESRIKQFTITLTELSGNKKEINVFPYEYLARYHNQIIDLFEKNEPSIIFDIFKNKTHIDINKILYSQNIYKDQEFTIIFSTYNIPLQILEVYDVDPITIQTYNRLLDDITMMINTSPLPDDIYYQIKSVFCFTRNKMKMIWFDHDIVDINVYLYSYGIKSRDDEIYLSYCPRCLEGSNACSHECLVEALRFTQMLPKLLQILDDFEPNYCLTF
jgi:hypothetical protein